MPKATLAEAKVKQIWEYIDSPTGETIPQVLARVGISKNSFVKIKKNYVPKTKDEKQFSEVEQALMNMINRGNATAAQVLLKWKGEMVERTEEVHVHLTAADIIDIRDKARRELEADGMVQV